MPNYTKYENMCFASWFQPFINDKDCLNCHSKFKNIPKARTFHGILEQKLSSF